MKPVDFAVLLADSLPEKAALIREYWQQDGNSLAAYGLLSMLRDDLVIAVRREGVKAIEPYCRRLFDTLENLYGKASSSLKDAIAIEIVESLMANDAAPFLFQEYYGPELRSLDKKIRSTLRSGPNA